MIDISANLSGIQFDSCIMNASGPLDTTLEELTNIATSASGGIVMKSCTVELREGNPEPRYVDVDWGSINSMGLPNLGYKYYNEITPKLKPYGKPLIASIAGANSEEYKTIVEKFNSSNVDILEINLSCPNVVGRPQIGYDFEMSEEIMNIVGDVSDKPWGVKLPPYFDFVHFEEMASILNRSKISFIVSINSIGNALFIDWETEKVVIKPKGGFGGLGGKYIKPTALANVRKFHELLNEKIKIVGVGGIYTGIDAFEFILAGATLLQLGTSFSQEGPPVFERVSKELSQIMEKKGYTSLDDFRGKLKVMM
ncbi:MAG: dihydroorotate oxidase [Candidatus Methanofastidiosum sp.]|nr:dihydroorotate oxidase [Methanofastidiosum sp.]